ncbi:hypothetical protein [Mongoliibacter ruber]|uniref:Uncharacterized protein n=1 Tax=Mongoliibacter ruber TaxID=1750599 RepID=A0A2T0WQX4_9BACT|nr:hypothetical protein [Mongoliibacter ruber]PRY89102.1 hypothetical protein CLW00_103224 [Mongoliibacter ruber]
MRICWILFLGLFIFASCNHTDEEVTIPPNSFYPDLEDLSEEIVYVRESDISVPPAFAWDMHTEARFSYTEGALLGMDGETRFFSGRERFRSTVNYAAANIKVNGVAMCRSDDQGCDYEDYRLSGAWNFVGEVRIPGYLEWEFIDLKKTKKFVLKFDELPKPAFITEYDPILRLEGSNLIRFQKNNESDSVFLQLNIIPKRNLNPDNLRNSISTSYPVMPQGNTFEIRGEDLFHNAQSIPTEKDSLFITVVTVKRIVKEVNETLFGFTYYTKDHRAVILQK